jgi:hypothetical protein
MTEFADQSEKLRELFELAEDNQHAVQDAIACFTAEREAFTKERLALAKASTQAAQVNETFKTLTERTIPVLQSTVETAIQASVMGVDSTKTNQNILGNAAKPILERFSSIAEMTDTLQGKVSAATQRLAWQWTLVVVLGLLSTMAVAYFSIQAIKNDREQLAQERAAFSAEVAQMQSTVLALERRGGRIRLDRCGSESRLCIEVSTDQGRGRETLKGAWYDNVKQVYLVIPRGY